MTRTWPSHTDLSPCEYVQELIIADMDDQNDFPAEEALSDSERQHMTAHMRECPACREYRDAMEPLQLALVADRDAIEVPADLNARIMGRIAKEVEQAPTPVIALKRPWRRKAIPSVAAAILLIALVIPLVHNRLGEHSGIVTPQSRTTAQVNNSAKSSVIASAGSANSVKVVSETLSNSSAKTMHSKPKVATAPQTGAIIIPQAAKIQARTLEESPAAAPVNDTGAPENATNIDSLELASVPASASQYMRETYSSDEQGDTYFDPVSNLVGF